MAMQPETGDLHIDTLLTNISIGYQNLNYIADQVFPIVQVQKRSDLIPAYDQSPWFRDEAKIRAPKTKSHRGGFTVGHDNYFCNRYSFGYEIADETRDNADNQWNLDRDAANFVTDKIYMSREIAIASNHFTAGVWGTDEVGGVDFAQWDDYANSQPMIDLANYSFDMEGQIGREPNTLVIGARVWNALRFHPDMIDLIKYTRVGLIDTTTFQDLTGVPRLLVGRGIYTDDPEGTPEASVTYKRIWGNHALWAYVAPSPSLMEPTAGYTFVWNRVPNAIQYVRRFRDEEREIDIIEGNTYYDHKVTGRRAGIFLKDAVS